MALDADCYNGLEKQRKEQAVQVLQKWSRSLRVNLMYSETSTSPLLVLPLSTSLL